MLLFHNSRRVFVWETRKRLQAPKAYFRQGRDHSRSGQDLLWARSGCPTPAGSLSCLAAALAYPAGQAGWRTRQGERAFRRPLTLRRQALSKSERRWIFKPNMKPTFFRTPSEFREWLEKNHATTDELWVGYYKKDSGKPSMTWPASVDEALCYGWIDGVRKSIDEISYKIRFTPRKPGSIWSSVNIKRAQSLIEQGQMRPAGLQAYRARKENKSGMYSYEQRSVELADPYNRMLKNNKEAWSFFQAQAPSYRKAVSWWVISARREETRLKRLEKLIAFSVQGQTLPELTPRKPVR